MNQKKLQGAKAQWHDVQTLVSASAAKSYFSYKLCKEVLDNLQEDYSSRIKQQEITKLNVKVGLESKSSEYLAEARISQAKTSLVNKETECESEIKGLVALTGINEEELNKMLNQKQAMKLDFKIPKMVPGDLIEQRPDVYAAKKNLQALYDNLSLANKQRRPDMPRCKSKVPISSPLVRLNSAKMYLARRVKRVSCRVDNVLTKWLGMGQRKVGCRIMTC